LEALMSNKEAFVSGGKEEMFNEIYERVKAGIAAAPEMAAKWVQAYTFPGVDHMPTSWSFPSGHTSSSFAAATAVFSVNKKWGIPAYVFAAIVGFSRIYLGVHYCTDVLAGAVLGVVYGIIGVLIVSLIIKALKKNEKTAKFFE
ncbi:MAG: phosphatase PAP2 family protein, partial [Clostridia bacterium]|nr:phosphatase PAP2 family protein [Clostridia bacterium]